MEKYIKKEDEYTWKNYTKEYSNQIKQEVSKENDLIITDFEIKNNDIIFKDNLHPNWMEIYYQIVRTKVNSAFECGCGSGQHLLNINIINSKLDIGGCDLLKSQIDFGSEFFKLNKTFVSKIKILDFSLEKAWEQFKKKYDFVYSQAVITHINYNKAINFLTNMLYLSNKYVLLIERQSSNEDHNYDYMLDIIRTENKNLVFKVERTVKYCKTGILITKG